MTGAKIQQQIYTRAREGLFQSGEGFDTVAKSQGLDNGFIKKTLHPYCLYIAPQELLRRGEKDPSRYPAARTVFTADSGELVIGQNVFAGSDYTGQRDVIFSHHFIVPNQRRVELLRNPQALFRLEGFMRSYDSSLGKELPELEELPYEAGFDPGSRDDVLRQLNVGEPLFRSLLAAIFAAVSSKKKVYIALDADISESSVLAAQLLEVLYYCMPLEVRRQFGFTTYNNEPQGRKNIDVMFVEKGSIRSGDGAIGKDLAFDFPNNRFPVGDLGKQGSFLDYAWDNRNNPLALDSFYRFAEEALEGCSLADKLSLDVYNQLANLYQIRKGKKDRYTEDRGAVIESALHCLRVSDAVKKPVLVELLLDLMRDEVAQATHKADSFPNESGKQEDDVMPVRVFAGYSELYGFVSNEQKLELSAALITFLNRASAILVNDELNTYLADAGSVLKKQPMLQKLLYEQIGRDVRYAGLIEALLAERLVRVKSVKELQEEVAFWTDHSLHALRLSAIIQKFREKTRKLLLTSNEPFVSGSSIFSLCEQLHRRYRGDKGFEDFCDAIEIETACCVLDRLTLTAIELADLQQIEYILSEDRLQTGVGLSEEQVKKLILLRAVQELIATKGLAARELLGDHSKTPVSFDFSDLSDLDMKEVQRIIQRFLTGPFTSEEHYIHAVFSFAEWNTSYRGTNYQIAYQKLLQFQHRQSEGSEEMWDFLIWSSNSPFFKDESGKKLRTPYRIALRKFFQDTEPKALRKREIYDLLTCSVAGKEFRDVIKQIRDEQTTPVLRFVKRYRRFLTILTVFALVIVAVVIVIVKVLGSPEESPGTMEPSPSPGISTIPSGTLAPGSPSGGVTATPVGSTTSVPSSTGIGGTPSITPSGSVSPSGSVIPSSSPSPSASGSGNISPSPTPTE